MPFLIGLIKSPLTKWIGGGIVLALAVWFAVHKWNDYKANLIEQGRLAGRDEITKEYKAQVANNDHVNREVEKRLDLALNSYMGRLQQTLDRVQGQSAKIAKNVTNNIDSRPEIFANPVCETPQDTIDARNSIRALGPPFLTPQTK